MNIFEKNSVGYKILWPVLITVTLALLLISIAVTVLNINTVNEQIDTMSNIRLEETIQSLEGKLEVHAQLVDGLGSSLGVSGTGIPSSDYQALLTSQVALNNDTYGSGVFYDYYAYSPGVKYFGPYAYRENNTVSYAEDLYSTDEYDYPNQDWYLVGKNAGGELAWSDPFYDDALDITMVTAAKAFYDNSGTFKGVVTGDIDLSSLQQIVSDIKIGETGHAFLLDASGLYLSDQDTSKVMSINILEDPNSSLSAIGNDILSGESGSASFTNDLGTNRLYYAPLGQTGWVLAIVQAESEINEPIMTMIYQLIGLILVTLIILTLVIIKIVRGVVKPIVTVTDLFANTELGDFNSEVPAEILNRKDELGKLGQSFQRLSENIRGNIDILHSISQGDLNVSVTVRSDQDIQSQSFLELINTLKNVDLEVKQLSEAATKGELSQRGNPDRFKGQFKDLVAELNAILDAVIKPLNVAADYVDKISHGNLPEKITDPYQGDFNTIKNNLNQCIDNIDALVADVNTLATAATQGDLSVQADESQHSGDFRKIVQGFNDTLNSIIAPINEARGVMAQLAVNDYSASMQGSYKGDMQDFADEINHVYSRLQNVQNVFNEIAAGDTRRLNDFKAIGKRSENDQLIPAIISTFSTIEGLIAESQNMAQAGINGDLALRCDISQFEGGYRDIMEGFNQTLDAIERPINEAAAILEEMANGNLTLAMTGHYQGSYAIIKDSLNHTLGELNGILGSINHAADEVASGSRQVSDGSQALAQGATEQASSMQELNASISEVANQTKDNAQNADHANKLTVTAQDNAQNGNNQMREMLTSMEEINQSSSKISNIIRVIDDIAFQTNILALNAAVEAARAGEHGKGFAVVAEEVRTLASRSAEAARETTELIESSIASVNEGTVIANNTAESLAEIVSNIEQVAELVHKIDQASNDQTASINQINVGFDQVSQVVQNNSATAEESAASSQELYSQAELLKSMVSRFDLKR
ncbi:MAG: methyl-accepting chemotaxis protein [Eubacteriaceae bacterium]